MAKGVEKKVIEYLEKIRKEDRKINLFFGCKKIERKVYKYSNCYSISMLPGDRNGSPDESFFLNSEYLSSGGFLGWNKL